MPQKRGQFRSGYTDPDDQPDLDRVRQMTTCQCEGGPSVTAVEVGSEIVVGKKEIVKRVQRVCLRCGKSC